jgi:hypothetical protein
MAGSCSVTVWSAVSSATANATLAAVLAGFMINAIILLLGTKDMTARAGYVHALTLLFTAFIALGLDSYLFGLVTGEGAGASQCRRAWTEAVLAAGLLGIGTVAIIAGFVFLFAVYFSDNTNDLGASLHLLQDVCTLVRTGVVVVVMALLWLSAHSYLAAVFPSGPPRLARYLVDGYLGLGLLVVAMLTVTLPLAVLRRDEEPSGLIKWLRASGPPHFIRALRLGVFAALLYSVSTVLFAAVVTSRPVTFWNPASGDVRAVAVAAVLWMLVVPLLPIYMLTARVVPAFT